MTTKAYKGGGTGSRNWGKDENEKIYSKKMSGGIHVWNYMDNGYTKGRNDEEMFLNHRYQKQFMGRYMVRMNNQMTMYLKSEKGNMKEEVAGKIKKKTSSAARVDLGNQSGKGENCEASGNDAKERESKETAIEVYCKLNRLPSGSMIGQHMVQHLSEQDQERVLLSLVATKGNHKFSSTKEELARKWMWHSR